MPTDREQLFADPNERIAAKKSETKPTRPKPTPSTRRSVNCQNSLKSTGPKSEAGKARASANSLKHGFYANVEKLNPQDSASYLEKVHDLRHGLHPDGPAEEQLVRDLAMFAARLERLEAAEHAILCAAMDADPEPLNFLGHVEIDARPIAAAYLNNLDAIERLQKIEVHLRRAYNRAWDRLERMQKERHKLSLDEMLKRTQVWLTAEAIRNNRPHLIPRRDPRIDEKGKLIKHEKGDPLYHPKEKHIEDEIDDEVDNIREPLAA